MVLFGDTQIESHVFDFLAAQYPLQPILDVPFVARIRKKRFVSSIVSFMDFASRTA